MIWVCSFCFKDVCFNGINTSVLSLNVKLSSQCIRYQLDLDLTRLANTYASILPQQSVCCSHTGNLFIYCLHLHVDKITTIYLRKNTNFLPDFHTAEHKLVSSAEILLSRKDQSMIDWIDENSPERVEINLEQRESIIYTGLPQNRIRLKKRNAKGKRMIISEGKTEILKENDAFQRNKFTCMSKIG